MPFTLSHVLAVYPFKKLTPKYFSASGLIVGSMAPDFEFFIRVTLYGIWGHTFWGIFLFNLPISIALCLLFHQVIKRPLILHLPGPLYARFYKHLEVNWLVFFRENVVKVVLSILLGIFTHFLWDNFTHEPNYVSPFYIDCLLEDIFLFGNNIPLYDTLWLTSSFAGLAGFLLFIYMVKVDPATPQRKNTTINWYWGLVVGIAAVVILIRYVIGVPDEKPKEQLLVICISAFLIGLTLTSWFWQRRNIPNED
jgi:hypothetical protein